MKTSFEAGKFVVLKSYDLSLSLKTRQFFYKTSIHFTTIMKIHLLFNKDSRGISDEITQLGNLFICESKELVQLGTKGVISDDATKIVFTIEDLGKK